MGENVWHQSSTTLHARMCSLLEQEAVESIVTQLLDASQRNPRKFVETIELQIVLRDYDPSRDRRFRGTTQLPHPTRYRSPRVCIIADEIHYEEAMRLRIDNITKEEIASFRRNRKFIKKWMKQYEHLLTSSDMIRLIP